MGNAKCMRIISPKLPRSAAIRRSWCLKDERLIHTRIEVKLRYFPRDIYPWIGKVTSGNDCKSKSLVGILLFIVLLNYLSNQFYYPTFFYPRILSKDIYIEYIDFLKKDSKPVCNVIDRFDKYKSGQQWRAIHSFL